MIDLESLLKKSNMSIGQPKENGGTNFTRIPSEMNGYKLFYPMQGEKASIRILYNKKSDSILRDIKRHEYTLPSKFKVKAPCLKAYDMDCPICNTLQTITDVKGAEILNGVHKFTKRFIAFAYINSIEGKPKDHDINAGEVVLFMFPRTIAEEVKGILDSCKSIEDVQKFFYSNNSLSFTISVDKQVSTSMYKFMPDALMGQTKLYENEAEYEKLLDSLPDLNDMLVPATFQEDFLTLANEVSDSLSKEYLNGSVEATTLNNIDGEGRAAEAMKTAQQINEAIAQTQPTPQPVVPTPNTIQQVPMQAQPQGITTSTTGAQPQVATQVVTTTPDPTIQQAQPTQIPQVETVAQATPTVEQPVSNVPECFGNYNELEAKCLICANSVECSTKSIK